MKIFGAISITVIILVILYFLICFLVFRKIFAREKNISKTEEEFYNNNDKQIGEKIKSAKDNFGKYKFRRVRIYASDEAELTGRLYAAQENTRTVILCHGYKSFPEFDFGLVIDEYAEKGYNVLVIDERAHSRSGGKYTTLGISEAYDIVMWCIWAELNFGTGCSVTLHGVSMGAFACLVAAANPEIPKNVEKVVADSMYESVMCIVERQIRSLFSFLSPLVLKTVNMYFRTFAGCDIRDFSLVKILPRIKIPVLFLHCGQDGIFSPEEAEKLSTFAAGRKTLKIIPEAKHGLSFAYDEEGCRKVLSDFLSEK